MTSKTTTKQTAKAHAKAPAKAPAKTTARTVEQTAADAAEQIGAETRKTVEQGTETVRQGLETAAAFNQGNIEAVVVSSQIAAKAMENVTSEIAAYSKKSYEDSMAAAKELSSCRSVAELLEKQAEFSRSSLESFVAEASKLNDMYATAAKETLEPLGKRFTVAVDMAKDTRA